MALYALVGVAVGLALLALFIFTVYVFIQHRRYSHIPSPKGAWFFFGHLPAVVSKMRAGLCFSKVLLCWHSEVGPIFIFWYMHKPWLITTDPDHIKVLAQARISKPRLSVVEKGWGQRFMGKSIDLLQHYDEWRDRRSVYDPAFARSYLKELVPVFNKVAKSVLEERMKGKADGTTVVDVKEVFDQIAFEIISQVAFGTDFSKDPFTQKVAGSEGLQPVLENALAGVLELFTNPFAKYLLPWHGRKYAKSERTLRAVGRNCIEQRIEALKNKQDVPQDILLRMLQLLEIDEKKDIEEIVDDFVSFYLAGQETTANLLSFALILLLKHGDILHRLMEEVDEVVGDKETVDADDLGNLEYMQQVLQEALRLYPPATAILRLSPPDLVVCGKPIPQNVQVMININGAHHSEENYINPEMFDPDRFDLGQKRRPSPYSYLPFGIGPRICIGKVFAMMEAKVVLCHLLQSFELCLPEDFQLKIKETVVISPADGVPCTFMLR